MVGTRQLARVIDECLKSKATLILSGDTKQLQAIELGGAFAEISRRYPAAELTEIRRQRERGQRGRKGFFSGRCRKSDFSYRERGLAVETTGDLGPP